MPPKIAEMRRGAVHAVLKTTCALLNSRGGALLIGVRDDGTCEVKPDMKCVWVEAYRGSKRIPGGVAAMTKVQHAVDQRLAGRSSWLRVVRELNPTELAKDAPPRKSGVS